MSKDIEQCTHWSTRIIDARVEGLDPGPTGVVLECKQCEGIWFEERPTIRSKNEFPQSG